jgi:hypothetical protein
MRTDKHEEDNRRFSQTIRTCLKAPDYQLAATSTPSSHFYCFSIAATLCDERQKGRGSTPDKNTFYGRHVFQIDRGVRPPLYLASTGTLSTGVELPCRKVDHSPSPTSQVTNAWSYIATFPIHLHYVALH